MSFDKEPEKTADQLSFTVGERSFTAESAATKIEHAESHINTIESENQGYKDRIAALEAQVSQATKIDEALAKLQQQPTQETPATEVTPSVSAEQIGEIATKQIEEYLASKQVQDSQLAAQTLATKTFDETEARLKAKFGDTYKDAVQTQATKLGVSLERMTQMASDPATAQLLLAQMDVSPTPAQATPSSSFSQPSEESTKIEIDWSQGGSKHILEALQTARAS